MALQSKNQPAVHGDETSPLDVDLLSLILIIWRRKFIVFVAVMFGLAVAFTMISIVPPRYTASSLILVHSDMMQEMPKSLSLSKNTIAFDTGAILTETEVLKSRTLAAQTVKRMSLMKDQEFNPVFGNDEISAHIDDKQKQGFRNLSVHGAELKTLPPEAIDKNVSETVTKFLESLKISPVPGSLAIKISFSSSNPHKAALITNTFVDEYIKLKLSQKYEAQQRVTNWLDERLKKLRAQLLSLETEIQNHKVLHNISAGKGGTLTTERLSEFNEQIVLAKSHYVDIKSQLEQLAKLNGDTIPTGYNSKILNTPLVRELQSEKLRLETNMAEFSNRYGPKHPLMVKTKSEIQDIEGSITEELQNAKRALKAELMAAQTQIEEIENNINEATSQQHEDSLAMIRLRELEREADASRLALQTFLESYQHALGKNQLQKDSVQILSHASVPYTASYPNKALILVLSIFVSFIMGVLVAVLVEKANRLKA